MRLQYKDKNVNNNDKISTDEVTTKDVRKPNEETETNPKSNQEIESKKQLMSRLSRILKILMSPMT